MTQTARGLVPVPGSWMSIGLIYAYGVLTSASLSKIIPVLGDIGTHLGATAQQTAWLIALLGVLPAILAAIAGSIVDRVGSRRVLQLVALTGILVNLAYLTAATLQGFMIIRVCEGLIAVGAYSAAPALIMATTSDARRGRAMAVWSTYTPVGFSLGLALGGAFAGTSNWRGGYLVHLILFALLLASSWLLPQAQVLAAAARRTAGLFSAWGQSGPLRLSLSFATLVLIGFGMSSVYPYWYSHLHDVPPGPASTILALINLAMIPAGFLAGALLARGWRDSRMLAGLLLATIVVAVPLFRPGLAEPLRQATMMLWMLVQGALIAVVTAALPRVVRDPRQGAAAAGLLSQLAAVATFFTPLIWQPILQHQWWPGFVAVTAAAAAAVWMLFPRQVR
jgi:DHA1 family inner membrane transport protein